MSKYIPSPHNQIKGWVDILNTYIGYRNHGYFVEVGAFDGVRWSPCWTLANAGWTGIFYEPQTDAWNKLNANYNKDQPRIYCVKKAISDFSGFATLYLGGSVSTIRADTKDLYMTIPEFKSTGLGSDDTELVSVETLDYEFLRLDVPVGFDVLSIDVEGSEVDVLNGFSIDVFLPRLVVIEAHEKFRSGIMSSKTSRINEYFDNVGYHKIYSDHINNIYARDKDASETPRDSC